MKKLPDTKLFTVCFFCHKPILIHRWRIEKFGERVFCSRQHLGLQRALEAQKVLICAYCGKQFQINPARKQGQHTFCSYQCATKFIGQNKKNKRPTVSCDQCGKTYQVVPSKYKTQTRFYCSVKCRILSWIGPNNPAFRSGFGRTPEYMGNWKSQRKLALQRDNYQCQVCNKRPKKVRYIHVHHLKPAYLFNGNWQEANQLQNLISLCHNCHIKVEKGLLPAQAKLI